MIERKYIKKHAPRSRTSSSALFEDADAPEEDPPPPIAAAISGNSSGRASM
jgi:hypothetical protein